MVTLRSLPAAGLRDPWAVIGIAFAAVLAALPGLLKLHLRTDGYALVPAHRAEIAEDKAIRQRFDARDLLVVLIRSPHSDGIYNRATLQLIRDLTAALKEIPDIPADQVTSLATEYSYRVIPGTLNFKSLLDPTPHSPADMQLLRDDLAKIALHNGTLISQDGKAAAIMVGAPPSADRTDLYARVCQIIADKAKGPERVDVTGAVVAEALLGLHILEDLGAPPRLLGIPTTRVDEATGGGLTGLLRKLVRRVGLLPLVMGLMVAFFVACFRGPGAALIPLAEVGGCLVIVFGVMGWLGVPVYLTTAIMPIFLITLGVADEIHIFTRFLQERRARPDISVNEALAVTMDELHVPIVLTAVTTVVGVVSFAMSPLQAVQAFGWFSSLGVIVCLLWSLAVMPALVSLCPPRWFARTPRPESPDTPAGALLLRIAGLYQRGRYAIVAVVLVLAGWAALGVRKVQVQDSWLEGFAPDSVFAEATRYFNTQFLGVHVLLAELDVTNPEHSGEVTDADMDEYSVRIPAGTPGQASLLVGSVLTLKRESPSATKDESVRDVRLRELANTWHSRVESYEVVGGSWVLRWQRQQGSPKVALAMHPGEKIHYSVRRRPYTEGEVLRQVAKFEDMLRGEQSLTVGGVLGPSTYAVTANYLAGGVDEARRIIPEPPERAEWCWEQYGRFRGPTRLRQLVDEDDTRGLVTVYLKNANFRDVGRLLGVMRDYERDELAPHGISLRLGGDVAVSQTLIASIVKTQVGSVAGSLVGIVIVVALLGRSLKWGLLAVLPCALSIEINFAAMGWWGIPLGVATSMFAAMTLGVGVDYAIHLVERFRLERERGAPPRLALANTLQFVGAATTVDALAVAAGVGLLVFSRVPANARLGALFVVSLLGCLATTLVLLPALLMWGAERNPAAEHRAVPKADAVSAATPTDASRVG